MKNKGRKHLAGINSKTGSMNCKGSFKSQNIYNYEEAI
jgi:hypothetical protein